MSQDEEYQWLCSNFGFMALYTYNSCCDLGRPSFGQAFGDQRLEVARFNAAYDEPEDSVFGDNRV